jgi:hypothetical protein
LTSLQVLEMAVAFYVPFAVMMLLFAAVIVLSQKGVQGVVERTIGPIILMLFGWSLNGGVYVSFRYGSVPILDGAEGALSLVWRWAVVVAVVALGCGLFVVGVMLLARHGGESAEHGNAREWFGRKRGDCGVAMVPGERGGTTESGAPKSALRSCCLAGVPANAAGYRGTWASSAGSPCHFLRTNNNAASAPGARRVRR